MDDGGNGSRREVRIPNLDDLARIARELDRAGARFVVIGGFAVAIHGFVRTTKDIDLLIDPSPENVTRVKQGLAFLEDNAAAEIESGDLLPYSVVRVADEIMVDLMASACGVTWSDASRRACLVEIRGQQIPIADVATLIATKQTVRPSDAQDRLFLEGLLAQDDPDGRHSGQ